MGKTAKWSNYYGIRLRQHLVSVTVWMLALAAVLWLLARQSENVGLRGITQAESRQIATEVTGRLMTISSQLFEHVRNGQVIAILQDDSVKAQLATAAAETARLRSELIAAEDRLIIEQQSQELTAKADHLAQLRRFAVDIEQIRLNILEIVTTQESDRITLQGKRLQLQRSQKLQHSGDLSEQELEIVQTEHDALAKKIGETEPMLQQRKDDLEQAHQRQDEFHRTVPNWPSIDKELEPLRLAVDVQERVVAELAVGRTMLVLKSPIDGVISELLKSCGEVVMPGETIMVISAEQPAEIIAFLPEGLSDQLEQASPVWVSKNNATTRTLKSAVISVAPAIEQVPPRLWLNPAIPQWGRRVLIAAPTELNLLPGELVTVYKR